MLSILKLMQVRNAQYNFFFFKYFNLSRLFKVCLLYFLFKIMEIGLKNML